MDCHNAIGSISGFPTQYQHEFWVVWFGGTIMCHEIWALPDLTSTWDQWQKCIHFLQHYSSNRDWTQIPEFLWWGWNSLADPQLRKPHHVSLYSGGCSGVSQTIHCLIFALTKLQKYVQVCMYIPPCIIICKPPFSIISLSSALFQAYARSSLFFMKSNSWEGAKKGLMLAPVKSVRVRIMFGEGVWFEQFWTFGDMFLLLLLDLENCLPRELLKCWPVVYSYHAYVNSTQPNHQEH